MTSAKITNSSIADPLPLAADRWVVRRKAALIEAVRNAEITLDEACRRYQLSPEEFTGWLAAFDKHGAPGLRVTRVQIYREKPRQHSEARLQPRFAQRGTLRRPV